MSRTHVFAMSWLLAVAASCGNQNDETLRADQVTPHEAKAESPDDDHDSDAELLEALLGDWVSKKTGRSLRAVLAKDRRSVELQVVDGGEFLGQYDAGETRIVLRIGSAKTYRVEDRYRPVAPAGWTYSPGGFVTCLEGFTEDETGHRLTARLVGPDVLRVTFVLVKSGLSETATKTIKGCTHEVDGTVTIDLVRKKP